MATAAKRVSAPIAWVDADGRMLPFTEIEEAQHAEAFREGLTRLVEFSEEPGEDDREFFRARGAARPDRPLRGCNESARLILLDAGAVGLLCCSPVLPNTRACR